MQVNFLDLKKINESFEPELTQAIERSVIFITIIFTIGWCHILSLIILLSFPSPPALPHQKPTDCLAVLHPGFVWNTLNTRAL